MRNSVFKNELDKIQNVSQKVTPQCAGSDGPARLPTVFVYKNQQPRVHRIKYSDFQN
jgi:hypothetical protein